MKKFLFYILLFFCQMNYAQGGEYEDVYPSDVISPVFNGGGMQKFNEFMDKEFDYSKVTKPGKLEAAFTIDEEGNLKNIRVTQVLDTESAIEIIRVLKKCPKWEPAKRNGKPFVVKIRYPMVFKQKQKPLNVVPNTNDTSSQNTNLSGEDNSIYNTAGIEIKPDFPGGLKEFYTYIGKNFKVPDVKDLKGKVFITFVVEKDGSLTDIKILRDIGYGTGEEAVRVLKNCPKWIPGEQSGKKVRVLYSLPISIQPSK